MTVLPKPPGDYLNEVDKILHVYRFLANNKPEKLCRKTLIADYNDITTQHQAIKASWMRRYVNNCGVWRELMMEQIKDVDYRYLLRCNIKFSDLPIKLPLR